MPDINQPLVIAWLARDPSYDPTVICWGDVDPPRPSSEVGSLRAEQEKEELAMEWKWGEMSDKTQRLWRKREALPPSRRLPQRDCDDNVNGSLISEEDNDEAKVVVNEEDYSV